MLNALLLSAFLLPPTPAQAPTVPVASPLPAASLEHLAACMVGHYTSDEQAKADPEAYKPVHLKVVRIWPERRDGIWLYVEQALATSLEKPYRQRVYHLNALKDGTFLSLIYAFKGDPLTHAGAWKAAKPLDGMSPQDLETRKGCGVYLAFDGKGTYTGSTHAQDCESNLRGASYATTDVTITPQAMTSWDRGFDRFGKQVWGAEKGGYIFKKTAP